MCTSAMKLLLLLLLFFLTPLSSSSSSHNNQELHLLLQFKNSLPNPSILPSWAPRHTPCSFFGISCSFSSSTITTVNLTGIPLTATLSSLSSTLLLLPHLLSLSLSSTNLSSSSSTTTLSCGPHLTTLDLSLNSLSDSVLFRSCPSLNSLNLSGNLLSSFSFRSGAAGIETLDLSYNRIYNIPTLPNTVKNLNLSGNIIAGEFILPDCSVLESLDVSDNHLGGEIGSGVLAGGCGRLSFLNLSSNHFAGGFPMGLEALDVADFSNNNFSGEIPGEVFRSLPSLRVLQLSFNNFSGKLENWVFNLSKLELLDLSSNRLSGSIPPCTSQNSVLRELYLQDNLFLGRIPASISNCTSLYSLDLSFNYLSGSIPPSLGSLSRLKDLILWQNLLAGEIPSDFNRLSGLENLILDDNVLTGPIPEGLSNCTNLNWLSLATNHLSGEIPSWIGKLENLAILKLGNNSFSGGIPEELGDCKSLIWLDLNSNNLSGRIPASLAKQSGNIAAGLVTGKRYVYLKNDGSKECHGAGNLLEFAGIRQEQLSRLPSRKSCNFTRIYGGNTQYTFNKNGSMIFLDLSYNQLEGEIPKEIGTMYYLSVLNLGHNLLSGQIPPDLGSLRFVGVFDLSHNMLQGPIPSSFSGLSLLSEIDLSNNKLNGTIPELGQLATFPSYRYENNSGLCGFPLPVCPKNTDRISSENTSSNTRRTYIVTFISTGLLLIVLFIFVAVIFALEIKKKRLKKLKSNTKEDNSRSNSGSANNSNWKLTGTKEALSIGLATFDDKPLQKLTFADLLEATNGFHDNSLIGSGGFGDVYKAQLKDGKTVAVKKLIHISGQGEREFMAEMETIGKVKHRNLVPLLGYCKVREERLLVYEYMKYGSLEDVLHDRRRAGIKLNWAARRKIAIGAARGLAFLHHNCIPHIIHRDMKSSNVLLDENFEARVSDFGMARMMNVTETHLSVSTVAGTPGYVPPEYYDSFRCTTKGDVYSYGVVLLELLTGKKSTDSSDFGDSNLVGWVKMHSKIKISDVFDKELLREDPSLELELLQHLKIACACLDDRPMRRPTMVKVMAMFKEIQAGPAVLVDSAPYSTANSVGEGSFDAADLSLKEEKEDKD